MRIFRLLATSALLAALASPALAAPATTGPVEQQPLNLIAIAMF